MGRCATGRAAGNPNIHQNVFCTWCCENHWTSERNAMLKCDSYLIHIEGGSIIADVRFGSSLYRATTRRSDDLCLGFRGLFDAAAVLVSRFFRFDWRDRCFHRASSRHPCVCCQTRGDPECWQEKPCQHQDSGEQQRKRSAGHRYNADTLPRWWMIPMWQLPR